MTVGKLLHRTMRARRTAALGLASLAALAIPQPGAADTLQLSLPVQCEPKRTCFVQHYVDADPSSAARDYACGSATYNGHNGTDFRLLSAAVAKRGVEVVAAADGKVLRLRDGVGDAFARETGKAGTADRECGNGVVVAHRDGLETQYCHLLQGSVVVVTGQPVRRGDVLGKVGYSGLADFAHLHFSVRRNGQVVDPFTGSSAPSAVATGAAPAPDCDRPHAGRPGAALWDAAAARRLAYSSAEIIQTAFAGAVPSWQSLEQDHEAFQPATRQGAGLVAFARLINLAAGDRVRFRLTGPAGFDMEHTNDAPSRPKPIFIAAAGRASRGAPFAAGLYRARIVVLRGSSAVAAATAELELK